MLVPILRDQGVQQGCREMASTFQIQNQMKEMTQLVNEKCKEMTENNNQRINDLLTQQILPTISNAIETHNQAAGKGGNLNDAPRTPQSCNSDRR